MIGCSTCTKRARTSSGTPRNASTGTLRFVHEKIGMYYPINQDLAKLLAESLEDSRWDLPYLGMQVLIEGLALAAFGLYRDMSTNPLVKQLLAYVMQDEARHVAFGRLALKDYYAEISPAERPSTLRTVARGRRTYGFSRSPGRFRPSSTPYVTHGSKHASSLGKPRSCAVGQTLAILSVVMPGRTNSMAASSHSRHCL